MLCCSFWRRRKTHQVPCVLNLYTEVFQEVWFMVDVWSHKFLPRSVFCMLESHLVSVRYLQKLSVCLRGKWACKPSFVQGTKEKGWLVVNSRKRGGSLLSSKGFLFPFSPYCEFFKKTTLPFCRVKTSKVMVWWGISLWTLTYLTKVRSSQKVLSCEACSGCLALNAELTGKMFLHLQASRFAAKPNLFLSLPLSPYPVTLFI